MRVRYVELCLMKARGGWRTRHVIHPRGGLGKDLGTVVSRARP